MIALEEEIARLLEEWGLTLAVAESATGGEVSHRILGALGKPALFKGSVIAYTNAVKAGVLGVRPEVLDKYTAVSPQVAEAMARGVRRLMKADIALATTGIAGPGGATPGKPVGLVYIAVAVGRRALQRKGRARSQGFHFQGDRAENRRSFCEAALHMLVEALTTWI
ncbi:MAG: CinA family protein [Chloroflexota bacterium]|nr:CinA family protein [Chloroflexota bacterium]